MAVLEADVPVDAAPETAGFVSLPLPPFSRLHSSSTTNTKMTTMEAARIFLVDTWFSPFSNMAFATVGSVKALISSGTVCIRLAGSSRMAQVST